MNRLIKYYLTIIAVLFIEFIGFSQNASAVFEKVQDTYKNCKNMSVDVTYSAYEDDSYTIPKEQRKGRLLKKGNKIFNDQGNLILVQDSKYRVTIQLERKMIKVDSPINIGNEDIDANLTLILKKATKVESTENEKTFIFRLYYENLYLNYKQIDIYINKNSYFIEKTVYKLKQVNEELEDETTRQYSPRLEMEYKNYKTKDISDVLFDTSVYVTESGGKISGNGKYSTYRLFLND